jgi:hypothetical protein
VGDIRGPSIGLGLDKTQDTSVHLCTCDHVFANASAVVSAKLIHNHNHEPEDWLSLALAPRLRDRLLDGSHHSTSSPRRPEM